MMLADLVSVRRRFRRSVRVGADAGVADIEGFVCTATAAQAIATTIDHVVGHGHGAFTWTGPYGCGKSTLAVVLAAALGQPGDVRDRALDTLPTDLRKRLGRDMRWSGRGWRVVPVNGRRADAASVMAEAIPEARPADVVRTLAELARNEACGVLVIIDEMGKLLEHAATDGGDTFLFQELAEAASRSDGRLIVIGVLHQAFDDYAYRLARETRDDWLKVQGRFVDIALSPTAEEQVELLSRAIQSGPRSDDPPAIAIVAETLARGREVGGVAARLGRCWPLNPVVACLLGPLSRRRFGQNQRSVFGFLGSAEPNGFQDFIATTTIDSDNLYDTDWLWRYLRANLEPSILASPDGHRWSIAVDAIERVEERGGEGVELSVLRTVALLDLFRERSGLSATAELVAAALSLDSGVVQDALASLVRRSAIVFRRHIGAYAIYAGSDFDIEAAIDEAKAEMVACDYSRLRATGVLTPILAKREYHDTGAMRWFEVDVATLEQAEERVAAWKPGNGAAGLFLLLVNEAGDGAARVRKVRSRLIELIGNASIAFGISTDSYMLRDLSHELVALERVQTTRPELKGDAVARREVASRLARVAGELEERLRCGLATTGWQVPAISDEELTGTGAAGLSSIASRMAAELYPKAPRIRNELLNRSKPSSNAMAAMRALMVAMAGHADEPRLGIKDFPAEGGLYASVLERTGLHREMTTGDFAFGAPAEDGNHRLSTLWQDGVRLLERRGAEGLGLSDLFALWRDRPYGVKDGLLPVLGLAFLLAQRHRTSIYLDGVFCSSVTDLLIDRLLQDPASVRLRVSDISERDGQILRGIADLVAELSGDVDGASADPLSVGRQLVALVMNAPAWVRRTGRLSPSALRVRNLAIAAHDPNKLLLDDLPRIVGGDASVGDIVAEMRTGLSDLAGAYDAMLASLADMLIAELRVRGAGAAALQSRAQAIMGITGNYRLDAFAARLSTFDGSREAIEGIASLAANRPPRDWVDRDVDAARIELASLAREFLRAEGLAHVQGRRDGSFSFALYMSDPEHGGVTTPEVSIDADELQEARALATRLRHVIGKDKVSREVAIAAAVELAAALAEGADETGPTRAAGAAR